MLLIAIMAVIVYATSTAVSYSLFASKSTTIMGPSGSSASLPSSKGIEEEDPALPRTEVCPLNGNMHTKQARDEWEKRRPLAVMIENHLEARPQSGLSSADVVYEAVAEGGITRFMAMFYCTYTGKGDIQVGPVRSARTYYLDWLSEYDGLYAHVGGANTPGPANALGQIIDYEIKDLNQFSIGFPTFWRDYERLGRAVATEHTMYSSVKKLWDVGAKKGWGAKDELGVAWDKKFVPWKSKDDEAGGSQTKITVNFWESQKDYTVEWSYDSECNCYKRKNGGTEHTDLNNKKQLSPKVVIIRFQQESSAKDGYPGDAHRLYTNKGTGDALVLQDGKVTKGKWSKPNRLAREKFTDLSGKEISLNRGQIWLQTVPTGSTVSY